MRFVVWSLQVVVFLLHTHVKRRSASAFPIVKTNSPKKWGSGGAISRNRPKDRHSISVPTYVSPLASRESIEEVLFVEPTAQLPLPLQSLLPPPPDPTSNLADDNFRALRRTLPTWVQHKIRDWGVLRWLVDTSTVLLAAPTVVRRYHPYALLQFLQLSSVVGPSQLAWLHERWTRHGQGADDINKNDVSVPTFRPMNVSFQEISYGPDHRQLIHVLQQHDKATTSTLQSPKDWVVFVHGGAWGSGFPALYRLAATPFLESNMNVAIVGYRTYPTAVVSQQVDDVEAAIHALLQTNQASRVILVGHSSGAHLCALGLLQGRFQEIRQQKQTLLAGFVGIAGVYDIPAHYRFESGRGVERISPMAAACGGSVAAWRQLSPTRLVADNSDGSTSAELPFSVPTLLCHGTRDTTVPYSSSANFFAKIAHVHPSNRLEVLPDTEHAETALHLMFGGKTQDVVMRWIQSL